MQESAMEQTSQTSRTSLDVRCPPAAAPASNDGSEVRDLVELVESAVDRYADKPAFGMLVDDQVKWTTFAEFGTLVDDLRSGLHSVGVRRGDTVAVISSNRLEWAVSVHAAIGLGARVVPMYEVQGREDWQHILQDSGASLCFVANAAVASCLAPMLPSLPQLQRVIHFEGPSDSPSSYRALLAHGLRHPMPSHKPRESDVAVLIYTSGTTGVPKGVKLTHWGLASNVSALLSTLYVEGNDLALSFLPWAHIFGGCIELNLGLITGTPMVLCPDPMLLAKYLPIVKPTVVLGVPRVWNKIYDSVTKLMGSQPLFQSAFAARAKQRRNEQPTAEELEALANAEASLFPLIRSALGGRIRYAASGAAALSREVGEFMDTLGIQVYEGYGMTETGGVATAPPYGQIRLGSVGKPLPNTRIVIDKSASGAGPDEGEIIVYGPGVMAGYHNQEEATRATMTDDGGLRTGDMGRLDEDGYLFITGRVKELYKLANGKYIAPVPIEEAIALSPYISQAVVHGAGKPFNVALVVPDLPAIVEWAKNNNVPHATGAELLSAPAVLSLLEAEVDKANEMFKDHERVKRIVIEPEELTTQNGMLTQTLKLKRRTFYEKYGATLERMYNRAAGASPRRSSHIRAFQSESQPDA